MAWRCTWWAEVMRVSLFRATQPDMMRRMVLGAMALTSSSSLLPCMPGIISSDKMASGARALTAARAAKGSVNPVTSHSRPKLRRTSTVVSKTGA